MPRSPESSLTPEPTPAWLDGLIARATEADGQPPFSDQSLVELRDGRRELIPIDAVAATIVRAGNPTEAELVVDPAHRHRGFGTRLLDTLVAENDSLVIWAHGDHADARTLAMRHGLEPVRRLLQLRAPVPPAGSQGGISTRSKNDDDALAGFTAFRPGADDAEWLALNARAFASHPEQGSLTQRDLDARIAEGWFDPADFLLLRDDAGALVAFCWLKVDGGIGEFYVVGVDPQRQGGGLGRRLVAAGLARLAEKGIRTAALYVEGDNTPALRLYRSFGFGDHAVDVQYSNRR